MGPLGFGLWPEKTHDMGSITVQLTSFLTSLDSATLLTFNQQQIYLFSQIQTSQTGGRTASVL